MNYLWLSEGLDTKKVSCRIVMPCWRHDRVGKLIFRVVELVIDREGGQMEME